MPSDWSHVEDPTAYANAIQRNIYARASAKRRRAWEEANPVLAAWVNYDGYTPVPMTDAEADAEGLDRGSYNHSSYTKHPAGSLPTFAREGLQTWGSLSPKATALLQQIHDERIGKDTARKAQWAAEAATAQPWTAGRQVVEGVVVSVKMVEDQFAPYSRYSPVPQIKKLVVKRDDGSRIYLSAGTALGSVERGARVRVTVTVEPKAGEPTFAFGKRPAKGEILTTTEGV